MAPGLKNSFFRQQQIGGAINLGFDTKAAKETKTNLSPKIALEIFVSM